MSPAERAIQVVIFGGAVALFWYGLVPTTFWTIEHWLGLDKRRRRR